MPGSLRKLLPPGGGARVVAERDLRDIERHLERPLTDEELAPATSIDDIAPIQLELFRAIAKSRIAARAYGYLLMVLARSEAPVEYCRLRERLNL